DQEPKVEGARQALEGGDARAVLPRLDAGDGRVAGAHALGQLLLRETELGPAHDDPPRDALVRRQPLVRRVVGRGLPPAAAGRLGCGRANGARRTLAHALSLPVLISMATSRHGASWPAARGGTRGSASIRSLKSSHRSWATAISRGGSFPVRFSNMW